MTSPAQALIPIFVYFAIGIVLRATGLADRDHAAFLYRLVFFVTLPALAFETIADKDLAAASLMLPVSAFLVSITIAAVAYLYARFARLEAPLAGVVIVGAGIAYHIFTIPFIIAILGAEVLADVLLYDVGNALFVASVGYAIATHYGDSATSSILASSAKVLRTPIFVAVVTAVIVSFAEIEVPRLVDAVAEPLGKMTAVLVPVALGISFSVARFDDMRIYPAIAIRMVGGCVLGLVVVAVLGLEGLVAVAIIACAASPIGFNTVTLASVARLDIDAAVASVTLSVAIGFVTTAAILLLGVS